jgi:hypothetical protein
MGKSEKYEMVADFAWYVSVLLDLSVMQGSDHGKEVAEQLMEISIRVEKVRPFLVDNMLSLILNHSLFFGQARSTIAEVLKAASWIIGEFSSIVSSVSSDLGDNENIIYWIEGPFGEENRSRWHGQNLHRMVVETLLNPISTNLSSSVQIVYIQAAMKVFFRVCLDGEVNCISECISSVKTQLPVFLQSSDLEVQERANVLRNLLSEFSIIRPDHENFSDLVLEQSQDFSLLDNRSNGSLSAIEAQNIFSAVLAEPFFTVHSKAQKKVPLPKDLDIDTAFNSKGIAKLLEFDIPVPAGFNKVAFLRDSFPRIPKSTEDEGTLLSKLLTSSESNQQTLSAVPRQEQETVFMLSSDRKGNDNNSKSLDVFSIQKKSKRGTRTKPVKVDRREMIPAGAISSDEENALPKTPKLVYKNF